MDTNQILNIIKKHAWWSEESPINHQVAEWAWRGFVEGAKHFDKKNLPYGIFIYKNHFLYEETPIESKKEQFDFLVEKYNEDKKYIYNKRKEFEIIKTRLIKEAWSFLRDINNLSRKNIAKKYKEITDDYVAQANYSLFFECVDPYTEYDLMPRLKNELFGLSNSEINNIASTMSVPSFFSFMDIERIDFLNACLDVIKDSNNLENVSVILEQKYIWIKTNYKYAIPKTCDEFKLEITEYISKFSETEISIELDKIKNKINNMYKEKQKLISKYNLSDDMTKIFEIINASGEIIDERKECAMQLTFILHRLLEHFEIILGADKKLLSYTTYDELYNWLEYDNKVNLTELEARGNFSVFYIKSRLPDKSDYGFITGDGAKQIYDELFPGQTMSEFKGTVASQSNEKIRGQISLVLDTTKDKLRTGNILVTTMTRPDFLPFMRRAKAIITDEGGLTCHAAIVSREMGIPCIIGTRIATKVLKDGDIVEVDANSGIVRILK